MSQHAREHPDEPPLHAAIPARHFERAKRNGNVPFMVWMRGWRDAAAGQARRPEYFQNADAEVRKHYEDGFTAGRATVLAASAHASQLFNYTPNVLRGADSPANDSTTTTPDGAV